MMVTERDADYKFELNEKGVADIKIPTTENEPNFSLKVKAD